ncbi:MAG: glycine/sarcosine/betaine reductase complex component C subunit alpha, partial [Fusobacteriaceae bacterium]
MDIKKLVGETFLEAADYIEGKISGKKVKIGITTLGSEHGVENMLSAARMAARNPGIEVILIGPKNETGLVTHETECENEAHNIMEELLDKVEIDACVTMHYNFPIGVSTVGRVISPAKGRELFIATTTGTSSTDKTEAMVKNAVYGNIVAKACGIENPTVGILNVDGAKAVERALKTLAGNGYGINFGTSGRADGGILMRGNDLLTGSVDVMVCDSLTGNILMKMFSSFSTGGSYEATGFGYGPGVGFGYERKIMIVSRASGAAVVKGAIEYA